MRHHIAQGNAQLVIGTHALIQETVEFDKLGLVIVDEQHRFGVMQRFRLMKKADEAEPDVLVMTATPIPRTLALTLYGDLDTSVLDELPPGRTPITTRCVGDERADEVWEFVRKQVAAGHQAYVVYPVIEEGAMEGELKAAIKMHDQLRTHEFPSLRVGLLHGRMSADEKDATMAAFQRGEIDVLVSTTVIEVGVDVPNATVMVIEHAERFGLSQLHQLRGRIGRGAAKSYCVLMTGGKVSVEAQQRLDAHGAHAERIRDRRAGSCSSAARASSSAHARRACRTSAWPTCCAIATCWRRRAKKRATCSPVRMPTYERRDRSRSAASAHPLESAVWVGGSGVTRHQISRGNAHD